MARNHLFLNPRLDWNRTSPVYFSTENAQFKPSHAYVESIHALLPDPIALLALPPEELAGVVLEHVHSLPDRERADLNRCNFGPPHVVDGYPPGYQEQISQALMEAWAWLERQGLLVPKAGSQGTSFVV